LAAAALHPDFIAVGGYVDITFCPHHSLTISLRNTGKVNTFTGVDLGNLTGGVFNLPTLLEGNNLGCFIFQLSAQAKPDILLQPLDSLQSLVGQLVAPLNCPELKAIDIVQLEALPGYRKNAVYG
jgi:hypothetical protein